MFAVIKTGGKQYKVAKDDVLEVERVAGDKGATKLGSPFVSGAVVEAEIVEHTRGDKVIIQKKRRRKGYDRKNGHRQDYTKVKILSLPA